MYRRLIVHEAHYSGFMIICESLYTALLDGALLLLIEIGDLGGSLTLIVIKEGGRNGFIIGKG